MTPLARDSSSCRPSSAAPRNPPKPYRPLAPWNGSPSRTIELNRGSCTDVSTHDVLGRLRMRGGTTELTLAGGTEGSNPAPSTGESCANPTGQAPAALFRFLARASAAADFGIALTGSPAAPR